MVLININEACDVRHALGCCGKITIILTQLRLLAMFAHYYDKNCVATT